MMCLMIDGKELVLYVSSERMVVEGLNGFGLSRRQGRLREYNERFKGTDTGITAFLAVQFSSCSIWCLSIWYAQQVVCECPKQGVT
jgi:hypothetical protein